MNVTSHRPLIALVTTLLGVIALLLPAGCGEDVEDNEVEIAFGELTDAVQRRDADGVYAFTTNRVRTFLAELHADLSDAERLVRLYFPTWQQETLSDRLALERLGGTTSGQELFGRLVDFDKIRAGEAVDAGLEHEPPVIEGDTATLRTAAGEVFRFVREDGTWRTTGYDAITTLPLVETLSANIETLRENVRRLRELYKSANDPKSPEGAFNQLRDGLVAGDGRIVLTLLDEPARKALGRVRETLAGLREAPAGTREERLAAAELADLPLDEATRSDRKLATALAKSGRLGELLGIDKRSAIHLVRLTSRSEAIVVSTEAEEFPFVREKDGMWHAADIAPLLEDALIDRLSPAKDAPKGD